MNSTKKGSNKGSGRTIKRAREKRQLSSIKRKRKRVFSYKNDVPRFDLSDFSEYQRNMTPYLQVVLLRDYLVVKMKLISKQTGIDLETAKVTTELDNYIRRYKSVC